MAPRPARTAPALAPAPHRARGLRARKYFSLSSNCFVLLLTWKFSTKARVLRCDALRQAEVRARGVTSCRGVRARAEQRTARAGAGAAWERVMQSSTGRGVTTEYFVDNLLTELSILTHPYHTYTIAEPSLPRRRACCRLWLPLYHQ